MLTFSYSFFCRIYFYFTKICISTPFRATTGHPYVCVPSGSGFLHYLFFYNTDFQYWLMNGPHTNIIWSYPTNEHIVNYTEHKRNLEKLKREKKKKDTVGKTWIVFGSSFKYDFLLKKLFCSFIFGSARLRCCAGFSLVAAHRLLMAVASIFAAHRC